jgi:Sugar (and other) transporter
LIYKGRDEEALNVLAAIEGNGADTNTPEVRYQYAIIKAAADADKNTEISWLTLITSRGISRVRRRLFLWLVIQAMNQLSGINIVVYYFSYILIHTIGRSELFSRIIAATASVD